MRRIRYYCFTILMVLIFSDHLLAKYIDINTNIPAIEYSEGQAYEITLTGGSFSDDVSIILIPKNAHAIVGNLKSQGYAVDLAVRNNIVFLADSLGDFRIINVENPSKPFEISTLKTKPMAIGVNLAGAGRAYISAYYGGVHTIDVSDLKYPKLISYQRYSPGRIIRTDIIDSNSGIISVADENGMSIIDTSNPYAYTTIGSYITDCQAVSVIVKDNLAVLSMRNEGFDLINIQDIYQPQLISHVDTPAMGTLIHNNRLFVVNEKSEFKIFNIISPDNPIQIAEWQTPGNAIHLDLQGDMLCIAYFDGIQFLDISDIDHIKEICDFKLPSHAFRVIMKDNMAYAACYSEGLIIVALPVSITPEALTQNELHFSLPSLPFTGEYILKIMDQNIQKEFNVNVLEKKTLSISPDQYYYGAIQANASSQTFTFTVSNQSTETIAIQPLSITGLYPSSYEITRDTCSNSSVNAASNCHLTIRYAPLFEGLHAVQLMIPFIDPFTLKPDSKRISLSGKGELNETYQLKKMIPTALRYDFYDITGITCDFDGNIYLAETKKHRILKYNQSGFMIHKWGRKGNKVGLMDHPFDIIFDKKESLYVADSTNHRIQKFSLHGQFKGSYGRMGTGEGQFLFPAKLAIDSKGNIYVANRLNDIQQFDSNMNYKKRWHITDREIAGMAIYENIINNEKFMYVIDSNRDVYQYDLNTNTVYSWSAASGHPELQYCGGISVDPNGLIYVLDGSIQTFNKDGIRTGEWGLPFCESGNCFSLPMGMAFDWNHDKAYVSDWDSLYIFTKEGELKNKLSYYSDLPGEMNEPRSIEIYKQKVYIADRNNHRIQIFDKELNSTETWNEYSDDHDEHFNFFYPEVIYSDIEGNIYISNNGARSLLIFNKDKKFKYQFQYFQGLEEENVRYTAIAVNENILYLFENIQCRILKINMDDNFSIIKIIGQKGTSEGKFSQCNEICLDSNGYIYVVERENSRVQKLDPDGNFVMMFGQNGTDVGQFQDPRAIAINSMDEIFVSDGFNYIQQFDSKGKYLFKFGSYGSGPGQFGSIFDIEIDPENDNIFYVIDSFNRIQVLEKKTWERGKAIIISGAGPDDSLWKETLSNSNLAYHTLNLQGFTKSNIHYLTFDTSLDLDNNNVADDVDGIPSIKNIKNAITKWAANTNELIIYLVDHGTYDKFVLERKENVAINSNDDIFLEASDLNKWLTEYENATNGKVIVIYDACHSGSFIDELEAKNRIIITSVTADEEAIMGESMSFSAYFWQYIGIGMNMKDAFDKAKNAMTYHGCTALMEANANSNPNEYTDFLMTENYYPGNATDYNSDAPDISIINDTIIAEGYTATVSGIVVKDPQGVQDVWAVVRPPMIEQQDAPNLITDLPRIYMNRMSGNNYDGSYETIYNQFSVSGEYTMLIYASDKYNNISFPKQIKITFKNPLHHRAIIVTGYSSLFYKPSDIVLKNAKMAIDTLIFQAYAPEDIYLLSTDSYPNNDIQSDTPHLSHLQTTITSWAATDTQDLILYFIGDAAHERFFMNANEILTPDILNQWLNDYQNQTLNDVILIYDGCKAQSFTDLLISDSNDYQRILIASTGSKQPAYFQPETYLCFSYHFWNEIDKGRYLIEAYNKATLLLKQKIDYQTPVIYDPYNRSYSMRIGFGRKAAGDTAVSDNAAVTMIDDATGIISVDIDSVDNDIQSVLALIKPSHSQLTTVNVYCDILCNAFPVIRLNNDHDNQYNAIYDAFTYYGPYDISIYVKDHQEKIYSVNEFEFFKQTGPDIYEPDNNWTQASVIRLNNLSYQKRCFHMADTLNETDEKDYIKFYVLPDRTYVVSLNTSIKENSGEIDVKMFVCGKQVTETNFTESGKLAWKSSKSGLAVLKIKNNLTTPDLLQAYDLKVDIQEFNENNRNLSGRVYDIYSQELITDAILISSIGASAISEPDIHPNYYLYNLPSSSQPIHLTVYADGYLPFHALIQENDIAKDIGLVSNKHALNQAISVLQVITNQTECYDSQLDYHFDHKISISDAIMLLNLIAEDNRK